MLSQAEIKDQLRQRLSGLKRGIGQLIKRKTTKCTIQLAGSTFDGLDSIDETEECDAQKIINDMKKYLDEFDENLDDNTEKFLREFEESDEGYEESYEQNEDINGLTKTYKKPDMGDSDLEFNTAYFEEDNKKCGAIMVRNYMAMSLLCRTCLDGDNSLTIDFMSRMIVIATGASIRLDFEEN